MTNMENNINETHNMVAALVISVNEITGILNTLLKTFNTPNIEIDMVINGIGKLLCSRFISNFTIKSYLGVLRSIMHEQYRTEIYCSPDEVADTEKLLSMLVNHVMDKTYSIVNKDNYTCVTALCPNMADRIFIITDVDLLKTKTINISYYSTEKEYV